MPRLRSLSSPIRLALSEIIGAPSGQDFKDLCRGVTALSTLFTRNRGRLNDAYMTDHKLRLAYLAYFLPVNLAKVQALLDELPTQARELAAPTQRLRLLDVGCGPGTGALAVLDWMLHQPWGRQMPLDVELWDRSRPALLEAQRLWATYVQSCVAPNVRLVPVCVDLERSGSLNRLAAPTNGPFDLIVVANTLNELYSTVRDPIRRRAKLVSKLLDRLEPHGTLLIIEPALRAVSRELHRVRDVLVAQNACTVYSPCLHELSCPALVKEGDWCHEERPWSPPPTVASIDQVVGFIKDALKFSYLVLRRDGRTLATRGLEIFRVVSELRHMKGETRAWLCNETGRVEVGRLDRERTQGNVTFDQWHRGAIVRVADIVRSAHQGKETHVRRITARSGVEVIRSV
ncbi:MAG: small ribosomal subunit Rsm22 family protein [Nitrospiraceae bacterium]